MRRLCLGSSKMHHSCWTRLFVYQSPMAPKGSGIGWLKLGCQMLPCRIGRGGIAQKQREGDGRTPRGILRALRGFYRPKTRLSKASGVKMRAIRQTDGWCDEAGHRSYNRWVTLPFSASHETLWREDHVYDIVLELSWNVTPRVQGRGSAIFLHLTNRQKSATAGCIALDASRVERVLARLSSKTRIICC
jgi:L,D-peptidoglycan transpeptidase YkuD (ErfK/YbiS/YcfS/YnhG family)